MSCKMTPRERAIAYSHKRLADEARRTFPRVYLSDELHKADMLQAARDRAREFLLAMSRANGDGVYLTGSDVSAMINANAPDDCQTVSRDDFEEMRRYAVCCWKLLEEIRDANKRPAESDPLGKITDLFRDASRFDPDYRETAVNMPDVLANME